MAEVTRKLLVVEMPEDQWMWIVAHFHESCRVHELSSAAELGQVAMEYAYRLQGLTVPFDKRLWNAKWEQFLGQAILDALTKRTEGGA